MKKKLYQDAAREIAEARSNAKSVGRISEKNGLFELEDAYAIQQINVQTAIRSGHRIIGRKIGLTSKAVQKQLGVDQPDFGILFSDMQYQDGDEISIKQLIQPKVEGEIAFVLKKDILNKDLTLNELISSIDYVLPAIEIVDSVVENWNITLFDTVADNASSALYVLGNQPTLISGLDLALEGMILEKNGQQVAMGIGAACLEHPLKSCLWLARKMIEYGEPLLAGEVILSGALGPMVTIEPGDHIRLRLTRLGEVNFYLNGL